MRRSIRGSSAPTRRGFTLVEMLVVIGVIVLLVSLTIAVIPVVTAQSGKRQTGTVLKLLDQAMETWELAADREMTYGTDDDPFDGAIYEIQETWIDSELLTEVLRRIRRNQEVTDQLRQIDPSLMQSDDEGTDQPLRVRDAWDSPILVIFPGRTPVQSDPLVDSDGTVRTLRENRLGVAVNRKVAFVSAGPDGRFGDLHLNVPFPDLDDGQLEDVEEAADNVYSYEVLKERPE